MLIHFCIPSNQCYIENGRKFIWNEVCMQNLELVSDRKTKYSPFKCGKQTGCHWWRHVCICVFCLSFFDEVVINSSLAKSWHNLCIEESTCHEMIIDLLKRFICTKCLIFCTFSFNIFKYDFHIDAERIIVKYQQLSASMVLKIWFYGAKILP